MNRKSPPKKRAKPTRLRPILGWALLAALVAVAAVTWATGGLERLSLAGLAEHRAALDAYVARQPFLAVALFVTLFAVATGACLPVALTLTLASGVLFGGLIGGAATILGATAGATLTYLAAHSALGAWVGRHVRRAPKLDAFIQKACDRPFPLMLAARLMPLFPFAPVNVAASLAGIPLRPFLAATVIGVIPSSFIYASVGAGLGDALADPARSAAKALASPALLWPLAGLALLSVASLALRPIVERLRPAD